MRLGPYHENWRTGAIDQVTKDDKLLRHQESRTQLFKIGIILAPMGTTVLGPRRGKRAHRKAHRKVVALSFEKIFTILYVAVAVKQRQRQRQRWTLQQKQLRMSSFNSLGANSQGCGPSDSGESRSGANGWRASQFHALASLRNLATRWLMQVVRSLSPRL